MKILSVETTPNPHSMKINLDQKLGPTMTYSVDSLSGAPAFVEKILIEIVGLKSVFVCGDFITLNKDPGGQWDGILAAARISIEEIEPASGGQISGHATSGSATEVLEQSQVLVQTFKGVPIQVKVVDTSGESRLSLGERFNQAAEMVQKESGANYLQERHWADHGMRYGNRNEIANDMVEELQGIFSQKALDRTVAKALNRVSEDGPTLKTVVQCLKHEDWQQRLWAVQELSQTAPEEAMAHLKYALQDKNAQVRRLAAAALGTTGSAEAVESLCTALIGDASIAVRRTAGDALSDIGEAAAQPAMCLALSDANRLVRWRAARFLNDLGNSEAMPPLAAAVKKESAYEVKLEMEAAMARILQGGQGAGPAWRRISEAGQ